MSVLRSASAEHAVKDDVLGLFDRALRLLEVVREVRIEERAVEKRLRGLRCRLDRVRRRRAEGQDG